MAIYVMFKCCKCQCENIQSSLKLHLLSCSLNVSNIYYNICEHFKVKYSYITHWRFIYWWQIEIKATAICRNCNSDYFFGNLKFDKDHYEYNDYYACQNCKTVLAFSVNGYNYGNDGRGFNLQKRLLQEEKERIRKIQEEERERMRKERKIEQMEKKLKKQIELNNELNRKIEENCDTNCIENEYNQLIMTIDTTFSNNLNFNVMEEMNNLINFQMIKS